MTPAIRTATTAMVPRTIRRRRRAFGSGKARTLPGAGSGAGLADVPGPWSDFVAEMTPVRDAGAPSRPELPWFGLP
jgi:hypothetical protein